MRIDRFFTLIAAAVAFFAIRFGDAANVWWKAGLVAIHAGDGSLAPVTLGVAFLLAAVCLMAAIYTYMYECDADYGSYGDYIENGIMTITASFCGFYLFAFIVGPLNNSEASWFEGWAILALAGAVPAVLNVNFWLRDAVKSVRNQVHSTSDRKLSEVCHRE